MKYKLEYEFIRKFSKILLWNIFLQYSFIKNIFESNFPIIYISKIFTLSIIDINVRDKIRLG